MEQIPAMAEYDPAVIEPFYPAGNGRRPYLLETMLRVHRMQYWYNLSDGASGKCPVRNRYAPVCPIILGYALPIAPPS